MEFEDSNSKSTGENQQKKTCADCGTTKTPLWRGGPAGPKSLCNACGIRSRKKRRDNLSLCRSSSNLDKKSKKVNNNISNSQNNKIRLGDGLKQRLLGVGREDGLKQRLLGVGREVLMRRSSVEKQRVKLGEEEQAAVLLMALSYGYVYA